MRKRLGPIALLLLAASLVAPSATLDAATPPASAAAVTPPDRVEEVPLLSEDQALGDPPTSRLEVRFPGERLSRTLVQWVLAVASHLIERNEHGFYNVRLSGEVTRDAAPVDRFDYRFDIPAPPDDDEPLALVFDRDLRPGHYQVALEIEDLSTGRSFHAADELEVPDLPEPAAAAEPPAEPSALRMPQGPPLTLLAAVAGGAINAALEALSRPPAAAPAPEAPPPPSIELVRPRQPILVGHHRFAAAVRGDGIERVRFLLDGEPVMTKTRPPYAVELDLGDEAEVRELTVEAWGGDPSAPLATDTMTLNTGQERFAVRLVSPEPGREAGGALTGRCRLEVPSGQRLTAVEYYLGDRPVAAVDRAPFDRPVPLGAVEGAAAVRVVARLADGRSAEDSVIVGSSAIGDEVDVHLVELYTAVVDGHGHALPGLTAEDFAVLEDGTPQAISRFERVTDLPLHVAVALDVSGSMSGALDGVLAAASGLLAAALDPEDRAAIITFDRFPRLAVDFTSDRALLANGMTALRAAGGTALHEGLLFALRQFDGIEGQRVVLLFSDGKEGSDQVATEAVLEYARRSGVTVYTIALGLPRGDQDERSLLRRLARETGGRAWFVDSADAVAAVARQIESDMRSRYLLAYQSSNPSGDDFRLVAVEVDRPGAEARTVRGYYP